MENNDFKTLVVILHAYAIKLSKYNSLINTVEEELKPAKVLMPKMPLSVFSTANPNLIVNKILQEIDEIWNNIEEEKKSNLKIIIIGHSMGALLARKLYVTACGENTNAPFEKEFYPKITRPWANKVDRLILFAGINKGWTINSHISLDKLIIFNFLILIGKLMRSCGCIPVAFKTKKGATFITQLRIQSLEMQKCAKDKGVGDALIVQLLGSIDDIVSPNDNIDLVTGNNFIYLDMPFSNHVNVIKMTGKYGECRKDTLKKVLIETRDELKEEQVIPIDEADANLMHRDDNIKNVVFIIHGIRDTGYWTQKIARKVIKMGKDAGGEYATETSTYGYFPMLPFLLSQFRKAKVEWLMDQYTENLALYPNARFSFIGHSNGTYLLAKALKDYPSCKFKNIVLAGSVVKKNYNWERLIKARRVENVYNLVANNDWVVGIFPKTFQTLYLQDLGSGGYDGFTYLPNKVQVKYIPGGHGAAIKETMWEEIAHVVVHGKMSENSNLPLAKRSIWMKMVGFLSPLIILAIITALYFLGTKIWSLSDVVYLQLFFTGLYLFAIWKVLTWF